MNLNKRLALPGAKCYRSSMGERRDKGDQTQQKIVSNNCLGLLGVSPSSFITETRDKEFTQSSLGVCVLSKKQGEQCLV